MAFVSHSNPNGVYVFEDHTSAQTNNSLVAAPGANRRIVITGIIYSALDAGTVKLVEDPAGTPVQKAQTVYVGATGGISAAYFSQPVKLTANTALGFTSTGSTNHSVGVFYFIE